jgi:hypothetical protein
MKRNRDLPAISSFCKEVNAGAWRYDSARPFAQIQKGDPELRFDAQYLALWESLLAIRDEEADSTCEYADACE